MARQFTLGKDERLKSRKAIEQLFKGGKSFAISPFRVYYHVPTSPLHSGQPLFNIQCGAGVSTKNFKRAVDRNRIKRLTREAWRLQKTLLHETLKGKKIQLEIFLIYTGKELPSYKEVYDKIGKILVKLHDIIVPVK